MPLRGGASDVGPIRSERGMWKLPRPGDKRASRELQHGRNTNAMSDVFSGDEGKSVESWKGKAHTMSEDGPHNATKPKSHYRELHLQLIFPFKETTCLDRTKIMVKIIHNAPYSSI